MKRRLNERERQKSQKLTVSDEQRNKFVDYTTYIDCLKETGVADEQIISVNLEDERTRMVVE